MDIIVMGIVAGLAGTLAMDSLNHLLARTGILLRIDVRMIGRMAAGWRHRRFRYSHPDEIEQVANEKLWLFHALYVRRGPCSPIRALLGSPGWRDCFTNMGTSLLSRDDSKLRFFSLSCHGAGNIRQAIS